MKYLFEKVENPKTMKESFIEAVEEVFFSNEHVAVVLGDIGHFGFKKIWESGKYSDRYFNIGILEQSMVGFSAGLSKAGLYPLIHTITPFLIERPYEQIKVDFGLNALSGCFLSVGGAFDYSTLGPTHHSYCDLALFSSIPNSFVYSVASFEELKTLLIHSVRNNQLSYIRMNRNIHNFYIDSDEISTSHLLNGKTITVVSSGGRLNDACDVIERFQQDFDITVDLFQITRIKPLDFSEIKLSILKTRKLLVVEDNFEIGSIYSKLLSEMKIEEAFKHDSVNIKNVVSGYGTYNELSEVAKVSNLEISNKLKKLLNIKL